MYLSKALIYLPNAKLILAFLVVCFGLPFNHSFSSIFIDVEIIALVPWSIMIALIVPILASNFFNSKYN